MPTDGQHAKFLYTILKQLDLKSIDWQAVASQLDITNGHAARMRYSRFKAQMEGHVPSPRRRTPGGSAPMSSARSRKSIKTECSKSKTRGLDQACGMQGDDDEVADPAATLPPGGIKTEHGTSERGSSEHCAPDHPAYLGVLPTMSASRSEEERRLLGAVDHQLTNLNRDFASANTATPPAYPSPPSPHHALALTPPPSSHHLHPHPHPPSQLHGHSHPYRPAIHAQPPRRDFGPYAAMYPQMTAEHAVLDPLLSLPQGPGGNGTDQGQARGQGQEQGSMHGHVKSEPRWDE